MPPTPTFRSLVATLACAGSVAAHPPDGCPPPVGTRHAALIEYLDARLVRTPDDPACLSKLGGAWLATARRSAAHEHYESGADAFRRLLSLEPESRTARVGLAYTCLGRHRFDEALELARAAARIAPDASEVIALLADAHLALGNDAEAAALANQLLDQGLSLESLSRVALLEQLRGHDGRAESLFRDALQAGAIMNAGAEELAWCRTMLGDLLLGRGRLDAAEEEYRAARSLDEHAHAATLGLARVAADRGEPALARTLLERLAADQPEPRNRVALGRVLEQLGDPEGARRWFDRAERDMRRDIDHGDLGHARELVELWLHRGADPRAAVDLALRDLREVRRDAGAFETAAWAMHHAGRHDEAVDLIREALRRGPSETRAVRRAARIHAAAGSSLEAELCRRRARSLNPTLPDLATND